MPLRRLAVRIAVALMVSLLASLPMSAEDRAADPSLLTVERLFVKKEFDTETLPEQRWSKRAAVSFTLDKPAEGEGKGPVRNDLATGAKENPRPRFAFVPKARTPR